MVRAEIDIKLEFKYYFFTTLVLFCATLKNYKTIAENSLTDVSNHHIKIRQTSRKIFNNEQGSVDVSQPLGHRCEAENQKHTHVEAVRWSS